MKARIALLTVLFVGMIAGLALPQDYPVTLIDDRGQEITISERPERIVIAGTTLYTEILIDIGAEDRLVGVTDSPDNPPEVADLPKVGPSFSPNVEEIIALEPDLVLGAWGKVRDKLEEVEIVVLTTGFIAGVPDIFDTVRTVGTAVGNLNQAGILIGRVAEEVVKIEGVVLGLPRPRAAFLYAGAPDAPPYAAGSGSIENELILRAGGENIFADVQGFPQVSFEELIARDPEFIFTDPAQIGNITGNELLEELSAVKAAQIFGIKASSVTSTRVAEALRMMAEILHLEAFRGE